MTSAGDDTASEFTDIIYDPPIHDGRDPLFISIEVLAIARRSSGLCCEMSEPTRKPLAQKLEADIMVSTCGLPVSSHLLLAHSVHH